MRNFLSFFIIFLLLMNVSAQSISSKKWSDLFSYNNVLALKDGGNGKIIAATENGIFYYTPSGGEITKLSKANGLHEVKVSAFDYSPATQMGLVGYESGAMDLITPDGIFYIVDIPLATGYTGSKRIIGISITGSQAAVATGYGVSVFNLDKKGFGDTAFFQNGAGYEACTGAFIKGNAMFAATASGLKMHAMDVAFPIYSGWNVVLQGSLTSLSGYGDTVAAASANSVSIGDGVSFKNINGFTNVKGISANKEGVAIADGNDISAYDLAGSFLGKMNASEPINTGIVEGGKIFAGSTFSGILDQSNNSYRPDGPYNNRSYKLFVKNGKIWVSTGGRDAFNNASPDSRNLGFYHYTGAEWVYPSLFKTNQLSQNPTAFNVLDVVPNPSDDGEIFFTNYTMTAGQGIYNMRWDGTNFALSKKFLYDTAPLYTRPVGCTYGDRGSLFCTFAKMEVPQNIGVGVYDGSKFLIKAINVTEGRVQKPVYSDGLLLVPVPGTADGSTGHIFLVYNDSGTPTNLSDDQTYILSENNGLGGNIRTISTAPDKGGDVWIGTSKGLKILPNASSEIKNPNTVVKPIIITQNGLGEELFRDAMILQIETDSGNQKWVSVSGGGVFYLAADGQQTREHFTKANSPLPNDEVTDIKVDEQTGKVYFATSDGIVVYQGDAQDVSTNFGKVLVYPNPVVAGNFKGNVKIRGLADTTNIRITDAAGNLVHQAVAHGGSYEWDLNNQKGQRVASGIYFVLMTNADGTDKSTAKIAVVN